MNDCRNPKEFVDYYLQQLRAGNFETAFHSLVEADADVVPLLIDACRSEKSPAIRAELISIVWNHRRQSAIPFLCDMLSDGESAVWKSALDGLVAIGGQESLNGLRRELDSGKSRSDPDFQKWIEEAMAQIHE